MTNNDMTPNCHRGNDLTPFQFDGRNVRLMDRDGEFWFVAGDVAAELGYDHTPHLLRFMDDDEKEVQNMDTLGGGQEVALISEAGLYRAIVQRRATKKMDDKLKARLTRFQRWVFHDVLPSIRKTGSYAVTPSVTVEGLLANPQQLLAITQGYALRIAELGHEVAGMKQQVDALDRISKADGLYGVRQACQLLQMEERKFVQWVQQISWVFRHSGSKTLMGFADKRKAGYLVHKLEVFTKQDGSEGSREVLKFTPAGIIALAKKLNIQLTEADFMAVDQRRAA